MRAYRLGPAQSPDLEAMRAGWADFVQACRLGPAQSPDLEARRAGRARLRAGLPARTCTKSGPGGDTGRSGPTSCGSGARSLHKVRTWRRCGPAAADFVQVWRPRPAQSPDPEARRAGQARLDAGLAPETCTKSGPGGEKSWSGPTTCRPAGSNLHKVRTRRRCGPVGPDFVQAWRP